MRIGVLILGFLVPFLGPLAKAIQLALRIYNAVADVVGQMQLYGMLLQGGHLKQLGRSLLNGYGHWCGPGIGAGPGENRAGVDAIDQSGTGPDYRGCRGHEYPEGSNNSDRLRMDKVFFRDLPTLFPKLHFVDVAFGGPSVGSTYKFSAIPFFGGLIVAREAYKHK